MAGRRLTRRQFLTGTAAIAALPTFAPLTGRAGAAFGAALVDPATAARNRLVVISLAGGNDGLNTVIPTADADGTQRWSVYRQVRPTLRYEPAEVLPLDRPADSERALGLHPALQRIHGMYRDGRVAIVQGVDYASHSFSHFEGTDTWHSGQPETMPDSGWIGRHLDRAGIGEGELRAIAIDSELPLVFRGRTNEGFVVPSVPLQFADGRAVLGNTRHDALELYGLHDPAEPLRHYAGALRDTTVDVVEALQEAGAPASTTAPLTNALLAARLLLEGDFGVECAYVSVGGYDTHAAQRPLHQNLLAALDTAVATFFDGDAALGIAPLAPGLADRTIVMTISEFGRRLGENGAAGTDHGTAAPVFVVGPTGGRLVPGLHGEHPDLGTTLLPRDNVTATTDLRSVYQAVLQDWLGDPEPSYSEPLGGLFVPLSP